MGPMLATEGELDQIAAHTTSQQSVKGAGAGARASNDWKQAKEGGVGYRVVRYPTQLPGLLSPKSLVEYGTNST